MDPNEPTPKMTTLIAAGMYDYSLRASTFIPAIGTRGIQTENKPTSWSCTITSLNASRPLVRAIRNNPDDAERDARLRFMAIFKGKNVHAISPNPEQVEKAKPKPAKVGELDEDAASLI